MCVSLCSECDSRFIRLLLYCRRRRRSLVLPCACVTCVRHTLRALFYVWLLCIILYSKLKSTPFRCVYKFIRLLFAWSFSFYALPFCTLFILFHEISSSKVEMFNDDLSFEWGFHSNPVFVRLLIFIDSAHNTRANTKTWNKWIDEVILNYVHSHWIAAQFLFLFNLFHFHSLFIATDEILKIELNTHMFSKKKFKKNLNNVVELLKHFPTAFTMRFQLLLSFQSVRSYSMNNHLINISVGNRTWCAKHEKQRVHD